MAFVNYPADLFAAYNTGVEWAERNVPGTVFVGAMPDADKAGYTDLGGPRSLFIHGYLETLKTIFPDGVVTKDGRIA